MNENYEQQAKDLRSRLSKIERENEQIFSVSENLKDLLQESLTENEKLYKSYQALRKETIHAALEVNTALLFEFIMSI